jgi:hypothetical protein
MVGRDQYAREMSDLRGVNLRGVNVGGAGS